MHLKIPSDINWRWQRLETGNFRRKQTCGVRAEGVPQNSALSSFPVIGHGGDFGQWDSDGHHAF